MTDEDRTKRFNTVRLDWDLLIVLTLKDLRVRYSKTLFGLAWAAAAPLVFAAFYGAFFALLNVRRPAGGWGAFLVGVAAWHWTAGALASAPGLYLRVFSLTYRLPARWGHHAAAAALCEGASLALVLPLAAAAGVALGTPPSLALLCALPLLAAAQAATLTGWTCVAASSNLVLRDIERFSGVAATALFFVTPVAFPADVFPPAARPWLTLNPAAVFVEAWRAAYAGTLEAPLLAAALLHGGVGLGLTAATRRLWGPRLAEFI